MLTVLSLLLSMLVQAPEGGDVPGRKPVWRARHIYHLTKFVERDDGIGFAVNPALAEEAGLKVFPRLLRLADVGRPPYAGS
ncbi:MAG: hypothetical protein P8R42_02700 [Candidatus Binatia bacterium]|nr:hypothetical protein [Candidatus Binatia bacterium]